MWFALLDARAYCWPMSSLLLSSTPVWFIHVIHLSMLQVQTDLRRTQAELSLYLLLKCPCLFWCFVNLVEICFAGIQEVLKLLISSQQLGGMWIKQQKKSHIINIESLIPKTQDAVIAVRQDRRKVLLVVISLFSFNLWLRFFDVCLFVLLSSDFFLTD